MSFLINILRNSIAIVFVTLCTKIGFGAVFTATMTATPNHTSCYSGNYSVDYAATVTMSRALPGTTYSFDLTQTTFKLRTTLSGSGGTVLLSNTGGTVVGSTISGSFNMASLLPGVYTIYASILVNNTTDGTSVVVTATTNFTVGIKTTWDYISDMLADPNSYSAKRTLQTAGNTYAKAISANIINANTDGWIDLGAQFGGTTGSVFFVIGKSTSSITDPTTQLHYIEFRKTGASTGEIYVKTSSTTYTLSGVTFSNRIRIARKTGNTIKFYLSDTETQITGSPTIIYTGELNIGVFATNLNDGASNITSSTGCVFENQFFHLKDDVEQSIAYVAGSKLKFKYDEDYFDAGGNLNYSIKCLNDDVVPTTVTVTKPNHTNWIEITLGAGGIPVTTGNIYLLEVRDSKGRKQYLKFKKA